MENEQEKKRPNEEKEDPTNKRQKKSQEWTKYEDMNNKLFEEFYKVFQNFSNFLVTKNYERK